MNLTFFLILLGLGYSVGQYIEKRHFKSIKSREKMTASLIGTTTKRWPSEMAIRDSRLVYGSVVVSHDYFKKVLASLRNIFGGNIKSYETLLDRAKRESMLRMKQSAGDAVAIINIRIETSTIGNNMRRKNIGCVEVLTYGTALYQ